MIWLKAYRGDHAESRPSNPAFTFVVALPVLQKTNQVRPLQRLDCFPTKMESFFPIAMHHRTPEMLVSKHQLLRAIEPKLRILASCIIWGKTGANQEHGQ